MSTGSLGGCDVCRQQFEEGRYPPAAYNRHDKRGFLYRCDVCGTYWEASEGHVEPVDTAYVLAEYPELQESTTLLEEYLDHSEREERDLARLITALVQSSVIVPLSAPYAGPQDSFLPVSFSRGGHEMLVVFSSFDRMNPLLTATTPHVSTMSGLAVLRLVQPLVGLVVNPESADQFELLPDVVAIALDAAEEDEMEAAAGPISRAELESWATQARYSPFPQAMKPGDMLLLGDMELSISIARRARSHVVEMTSRGGPRKLLGIFQTEADAMRLVAYWIASASGDDPGANADLVGATLEAGTASTHLTWPGGSAEFGPGISGKLEAKRFNWARGRTLEEIANGFGRPLRN